MKWIAVLLTIFLVGVCTATPTKLDIDHKECAKGPEYWCQNMQTAKSCGAVKHCIQEEWKNIKLLKDDTEICDLCKKMVQEAIDQLLSNETQEELKEVFEGTCRIYFPIKVLADECIKLVDEFIPELIEYLVSRMDPQTVCATAGLCNAAGFQDKFFARKLEITSLDELFEEKRLGDDIECELCQVVLRHLKDMMFTNTTKEELKDVLLAICSHLGSYAQNCKYAVNDYLDDMYNFLVNEFDPKVICKAVGLCSGTSKLLMKKFPSTKLTPAIPAVKIQPMLMRPLAKQKNDNICQLCEFIMEMLKMMLQDNKTKEAIKHTLDQVCNDLPTNFQQACRQFVDKYVEELIDFVVKGDPKAICSLLGLCKQMKPAVSSTTPVKESKLDECDICQVVINYIDNFLMDNATEQEITNAIEKVCNIVPKSLQPECRSLIETYGPEILQELMEFLDGLTVCTAIGLCSHTPEEVHLLGGKKCTYGPGYWCKSVKHARSCNAEEHCKKYVWKN